MKLRIFLLAIFSFFGESLWAQSITPLQLDSLSEQDSARYSKFEFQMEQYRESLGDSGFWFNQISSLHLPDSQLNARISKGKTWQKFKVNFRADSISGFEWLNEVAPASMDWPQFKRYANGILLNAANSGFPFAAWELSGKADSTDLFISAFFNPGAKFYWDSIIVLGTADLTAKFLIRYLQIKPGSSFQLDKLKLANNRLASLPFINVSRSSGIYFYGKKAKPFFFLEKRNASSFDGFLGLAPNNSINNRLLLTGDINLLLRNLGGSGKTVAARFRSFLAGSSELQLSFEDPVFFGLGLQFKTAFQLLRFDSLFIDLRGNLQWKYTLGKWGDIGIGYSFQRVNLIVIDTTAIRVTQRLPDFHSLRVNQYELIYSFNQTNKLINPTKGFKIDASAQIGLRSIPVEPQIAQLSFLKDGSSKNLYEAIQLNSIRYSFLLDAEHYFNFKRNWVWTNQLRSALIQAPVLFQNEYFRIGGLKTLRGFDEQRIFADKYLTGLSELRYLTGEGSYFCIFFNQAMFTNQQISSQMQVARGFGAGLNLETGSGLLALYYALGQQGSFPINFNAAKIHVGFTSLF